MKIIDLPSPNFDERVSAPDFLILHYTDMIGVQAALDRLRDPQAKVSAHYVVDEDGTLYSLVGEDKRAWHAGKSYWEGETDLNARSIGIEIVNPGHTNGYRAFPPAQMRALAALCKNILARHTIPAAHILAHSDIAPARKKDPGELFDWKFLAAEGVGLWPAPLKEDFEQAAALDLRAGLNDFGYDPAVDLKEAVTAFQRHFRPEIFGTGIEGTADGETKARLAALLRLKFA